ncbi:LacI family transcriptional regulator [Verrucomicrobia bacterium LW23]|nr:LacI family transcriptional regulator [Verrucomicrobia bacterium LW23]
MSSSRVTIRDIAAEVGLHFTTVSLALRNSPRLPQETRDRVREVAARLGYKYDPMLTALSAYRRTKTAPRYQATIAWINNWPRQNHLLQIPVFREYFMGAKARAEECGYVLEEFWLSEPGMTAEKLQRIFRARDIQGVLLAPQPTAQHRCPAFTLGELSVLAFGYSIQPPSLHVITNHHFHTMNLVLSELQKLGYKRIGLSVSEDWDRKVDHGWFGGMMWWHSQNPQVEVVPNYKGVAEDWDQMVRWVRQYKPDVVVSFDQTVRGMERAGLKIPEDVGFACLAITSKDEYMSGAYQNDTLIGRKAVDFLIDMLHRGERGMPEVPVRLLVESVWRPGKTLRRQG